jgi:Flp pilus assembly CpaE family ATPase
LNIAGKAARQQIGITCCRQQYCCYASKMKIVAILSQKGGAGKATLAQQSSKTANRHYILQATRIAAMPAR